MIHGYIVSPYAGSSGGPPGFSPRVALLRSAYVPQSAGASSILPSVVEPVPSFLGSLPGIAPQAAVAYP